MNTKMTTKIQIIIARKKVKSSKNNPSLVKFFVKYFFVIESGPKRNDDSLKGPIKILKF